MSHDITIEGGTSVRLPTAGKYCDRDIIITAEGGKEDLDAVLTEQDGLIDELREVLRGKTEGSGEEKIRSLINGSITEHADEEITSIRAYAFYNCNSLSSADFPSATTVGTYAFSGCSKLASVNLPKASTVNSRAFQNCTSLTKLDLPKATVLNDYLVYGCSSLVELNIPNATSGRGYAIAGSKIEHLYLPEFKSPGSSVFRNATYLRTVDMPALSSVQQYLFMGCSALETVTFPSTTSVSSQGMDSCSSLAYVDLPICKSIAAKGFYNCTALETLILRLSTATCTLANVNALTGTKIASGEGYIYFPAAQVETYKTATNWSTYAGQIRAIEDYPEITGG